MPPPFGPFPFVWILLFLCIGAMLWCCSTSKRQTVEKHLTEIEKRLSEIENLLREKK